MFVCMAHGQAHKQLKVVTIGDQPHSIEALLRFEIKNAHCYSSTDEAAIRSIIGDDASRSFLLIN